MPTLLLFLSLFFYSITHAAETGRLSFSPLGLVLEPFLTTMPPLPPGALAPKDDEQNNNSGAKKVAGMPSLLALSSQKDEKGKEKEIDFDARFKAAEARNTFLKDVQSDIDFFNKHEKGSFALTLLKSHIGKYNPYVPACYQAANMYASGTGDVAQDLLEAVRLYSLSLNNFDSSQKITAARGILEIPLSTSIEVDPNTLKCAKSILERARNSMYYYYVVTSQLNALVAGEQESISREKLQKKYNGYEALKKICPKDHVATLCDMQMAHIIGLYDRVTQQECNCMKNHFQAAIAGLNKPGMEIYDKDYFKKQAGGYELFELAYMSNDEIKIQNFMIQSAHLGHPGASFYCAQKLCDMNNFAAAADMYRQVLACPCTSLTNIAARRWLICAARQESGSEIQQSQSDPTVLEHYQQLVSKLKSVDDREIHSQQENNFCQDCKASCCFCAQCFEDINGFKNKSSQKLLEAFCQTAEVTSEQAQLVCEQCPGQLVDFYQKTIPKEKAEQVRLKKKLEHLVLHDDRAMGILAHLHKNFGEVGRAFPLYQKIAEDEQYSPKERCHAYLECARVYAAQQGDSEKVCGELEKLKKLKNKLPKRCSKNKQNKHTDCLCDKCLFSAESVRLLCNFGKKQPFGEQQSIYKMALEFEPNDIESLYRIVKLKIHDQREEAKKILYSIIEMTPKRQNDKKYYTKSQETYAHFLKNEGQIDQALWVLRDNDSKRALILKAECTFFKAKNEGNKVLREKLKSEAKTLFNKALKGKATFFVTFKACALIDSANIVDDIKERNKLMTCLTRLCTVRLEKGIYSNGHVKSIREGAGLFLNNHAHYLMESVKCDNGLAKCEKFANNSEYCKFVKKMPKEQREEMFTYLHNAATFGSMTACSSLAKLYSGEGVTWQDQEKAERYYKQIVEHEPNRSNDVFEYATFLNKQKRRNETLALFDTVCEKTKIALYFRNRGRCLWIGVGGRQDYDAACEDFERAVLFHTEPVEKEVAQNLATLCFFTKNKLFSCNAHKLKRLKKQLEKDFIDKQIMPVGAYLALGMLAVF